MEKLTFCPLHDKEIILLCVYPNCQNKFNCLNCLSSHYKIGHQPNFLEKRFIYDPTGRRNKFNLTNLVEHYKSTFDKVSRDKTRNSYSDITQALEDLHSKVNLLVRQSTEEILGKLKSKTDRLVKHLNESLDKQEISKFLSTEFFIDQVILYEKRLIAIENSLFKKDNQEAFEEEVFNVLSAMKEGFLDNTDQAVEKLCLKDNEINIYIDNIKEINQKYLLRISQMMYSLEDDLNKLLSLDKFEVLSTSTLGNVVNSGLTHSKGKRIKTFKKAKLLADINTIAKDSFHIVDNGHSKETSIKATTKQDKESKLNLNDIDFDSVSGRIMIDPMDRKDSFKVFFYKGIASDLIHCYTNINKFLSGESNALITLPSRISGTYAVVISGFLYYIELNSNKLAKFDLLKRLTIKAITLPEAQKSLNQRLDNNDIILIADKSGLYSIYNTPSSKLTVSKINTEDLNIIESWVIPYRHKSIAGPMFLNNGTLYFLQSYSNRPTSIQFCYDMINRTCSKDFIIPFENAGGFDTCLTYFDLVDRLITVNNGNVYEYEVVYFE